MTARDLGVTGRVWVTMGAWRWWPLPPRHCLCRPPSDGPSLSAVAATWRPPAGCCLSVPFFTHGVMWVSSPLFSEYLTGFGALDPHTPQRQDWDVGITENVPFGSEGARKNIKITGRNQLSLGHMTPPCAGWEAAMRHLGGMIGFEQGNIW